MGSKFKTKTKGKKVTDRKIEEDLGLLKNQLTRVLADYDNLRKRTEEEKMLWVKFSTQRVLTTLLPILDNFESAQKHLNDSGLAIAMGEFKKVFAEEGLEEINPKVDDNFDHRFHEAIDSVETQDREKEGEIAEVILTGWKYKSEENLPSDRIVLRHAKVKVYKINK